MIGRNADQWTSMVSYRIRPALVEARLMSKKRARDVIYIATLSEELRNVEAEIVAIEHDLQLISSTSAKDEAFAPSQLPDVDWIHSKSGELEARLHRIQQVSFSLTEWKPVTSSNR